MEWFKDWSLPACEAKSNLQWGFFPISVNWYGLGHSNTKGDRNVEKKALTGKWHYGQCSCSVARIQYLLNDTYVGKKINKNFSFIFLNFAIYFFRKIEWRNGQKFCKYHTEILTKKLLCVVFLFFMSQNLRIWNPNFHRSRNMMPILYAKNIAVEFPLVCCLLLLRDSRYAQISK